MNPSHPPRPLAAVAALVCLAGVGLAASRWHAVVAPARAIARPPVVRPLAPSTHAVAVPGAAAPVAHPNAALDPTDLGLRIAPRALAMPHVAVGESARFAIDGQRHGWVLQLAAGQALTTPAVGHGRVFVGAGFASTAVYALDAHTGALAWTGQTPDGGPTAAIVDDDDVLFNTESCTLFCFDARTGRQRWSHYLGDPLMSQPTASQGRVFSAYPDAGSPTGFSFAAMSLRTGAFVWHRAIAADVQTAAVLDGDAVYLTTMNGVVSRLRARDGHRDWSHALGAVSAPVVHDGVVEVAQRVRGGGERQLALGAGDGVERSHTDAARAPWNAGRPDAGGTPSGWAWEGERPSYADGRLYYGLGDELVARDAASGRVLWRRRYAHAPDTHVSARWVTSPAVVGSELVVGTRDGNLFALDVDTGATAWAYHVGEPIAQQPTVADGWVYAATARGKVVGLEIGDPAAFDGWAMWGGNAAHDGPSAHEPAAAPDALPTRGVLRAVAASRAARAAPPAATPDALPLVHTDIDARVDGHVARVTVSQDFANPFDHRLDAEYLFPLPSDAAVDGMDLRIGARTVHAAIAPRADARARYEHARACGAHAALLEQERPNLFRQAVANIAAHESVRVELRFAMTVPYHDGAYDLALPLATGSRFTPGQGGVTAAGPSGTVAVRVHVAAGVALDTLDSPSHVIASGAWRPGEDTADVRLEAGAVQPDRDFVLRWRPRVTAVEEPAVLAQRRGDEGFFTLLLHPDAHAPDDALSARELVFLVDTSSSMRGAPLAQSRALLHRAVDGLRPADRFRLIAFADDVRPLDATALAPTDPNRARAHAWIDALAATGSTVMVPALQAALADESDGATLRAIVLVTDGYVGNEREAFAAVHAGLGTSRLFAFGVGTSVNRYLLEGLAEEGRGTAQIVLPSEDPRAAAERFVAHLDRPVLTDITVDWGGLDVRDVYPRVVPDLYADRPLVLQGRYVRAGAGTVTLRGRVRGYAYERAVHVVLADDAHEHEALPSVWARARVHDVTRAMILGETPALVAEVTDLGMRFSLVTDYTSLIAVDGDGACHGRVPSSGLSGSFGALGAVAGGTVGFGGGMGYSAAGGYAVSHLAAPVTVGPMVRVAAPVVIGSISPETIRREVLRNDGQVRHCYELGLARDATLAGRVVVRFVIGSDGAVLVADVPDSTLADAAVGACIAEQARAWVFAAPPGGGTVTVNYPFVLAPAAPPAPSATRFTVEIVPAVPREMHAR